MEGWVISNNSTPNTPLFQHSTIPVQQWLITQSSITPLFHYPILLIPQVKNFHNLLAIVSRTPNFYLKAFIILYLSLVS